MKTIKERRAHDAKHKMQHVSFINVMDFIVSCENFDPTELEMMVAQKFETTQLAARAMVEDVLYVLAAGSDFAELDNRMNKLTTRTSGFRFGPDRSRTN